MVGEVEPTAARVRVLERMLKRIDWGFLVDQFGEEGAEKVVQASYDELQALREHLVPELCMEVA